MPHKFHLYLINIKLISFLTPWFCCFICLQCFNPSLGVKVMLYLKCQHQTNCSFSFSPLEVVQSFQISSLNYNIFGFLYAIFVQRRILHPELYFNPISPSPNLSTQDTLSYTQMQCSFMTHGNLLFYLPLKTVQF